MSYILDALKKVEREKGRKALPGGMTSIAGDLFLGQSAPSAKGGAWKVAALIIIAMLVTSGGTWLLLRGAGVKDGRTERPGAMVSQPPSPVPSPAPAATVVSPVPVPVPPSAANAGVPVSAPGLSEQTSADEQPPARINRRSARRAVTAPTPSKPAIQPPADIRLSGIAWQDERSARRAVVNGFLLKEGAVVAGCMVAEILADKVRFSSATGNFEMRLNAVVPAEGKR